MASLQEALTIDPEQVAVEIAAFIKRSVLQTLKRRGVVVGLSGGIDSSVCAALCVRALGAERVLGVFTPEADSAGESLELGTRVAEQLGIRTILEDITATLERAGCYQRRDEAIRSVIPAYGTHVGGGCDRWRAKLMLRPLGNGDGYRVSIIVAESPDGTLHSARPTAEAYRQVVAATNFKQRTRKMMEYYHADRMHYVVVGTPNRLEFDQGFFVKNGDGAADIKPIAHLYKTQVYRLAEHLGVPEAVRSRPPTTDTFSLQQGQDEFYFSLPYQQMDLCMCGLNLGVAPVDVAAATGLSEHQVQAAYADILSKRRATRYLHMPGLLCRRILEEL